MVSINLSFSCHMSLAIRHRHRKGQLLAEIKEYSGVRTKESVSIHEERVACMFYLAFKLEGREKKAW